MDSVKDIKDSHFSKESLPHFDLQSDEVRVELEPEKKVPDETNWRRFAVGSSLFYFFLHLSLIAAIFMNFYDYKSVKRMFKNFASVGNGIDIFAVIMLIAVLAAGSILTNLPKKLKVIMCVIITLCYWYLAFFLLRVSKKTKYRFTHYLLIGYTILASASFGLLISALTYKRKFPIDFGVSISLVITIFMTFMYIYYFELFDPFKFELLFVVASNALYAYYLQYDMRFMIRKRTFFYDYDDWFIGGIHLQTDIFARFWIDLFRKTPNVIDIEEAELSKAKSMASNAKTNDNTIINL